MGGKLITVFHGYDMTSYVKQHGENVYSGLFVKGDLFLPISNNWRNKLIKLGCPEKKIRIHRMGIDVQKFKYGNRSKNKREIAILTIARLVEKKGLSLLYRQLRK